MASLWMRKVGWFLMTYRDEVIKSMEMLSNDSRVIFLGQNTKYGTCSYDTLHNIPKEKIIEMPIAEDMQMGISIGLALNGYIPVTIYERMDFLILAINQLVNHLDKIEEMSKGVFKPIVIVRTIIGPKIPLYPGPQHCQDHTQMLKAGLTNINVVKLEKSFDIVNEYKKALNSNKSTLIIEVRQLYNDI
jgi:pyruvate/2-oxoglutarate/acetoin dehydrogenase E1 component